MLQAARANNGAKLAAQGAQEQRELLSMFRDGQRSHNGTGNSTQP